MLSPQGHTEKVRKTLLFLGYKFIKDFTLYSSGKFYDAISVEKGEDSYSNSELIFGRDNLLYKGDDFILKIQKELEFKKLLLNRNLSEVDALKIQNEINILKEVLNER